MNKAVTELHPLLKVDSWSLNENVVDLGFKIYCLEIMANTNLLDKT